MRRERPVVACPRCQGSGRVRAGGFGEGAFCYKCQGTGRAKGVFMDPASVARREAARRRAAGKRAAADARVAAWAKLNPRGHAWLAANAETNEFASNLIRYVRRHGALTSKQHYVLIQRMQEKRDDDIQTEHGSGGGASRGR